MDDYGKYRMVSSIKTNRRSQKQPSGNGGSGIGCLPILIFVIIATWLQCLEKGILP